MPRRNLLTPAERTSLLAFPATDDEFIQHYTFSESDLSVIRQRRGSHNRLGFAVQLCYLRYPGFALPTDAEPPTSWVTRSSMSSTSKVNSSAPGGSFSVSGSRMMMPSSEAVGLESTPYRSCRRAPMARAHGA